MTRALVWLTVALYILAAVAVVVIWWADGPVAVLWVACCAVFLLCVCLGGYPELRWWRR